jgi:uncharacterized protein
MIDLWILTHYRVGDLEQMRAFAATLEGKTLEKRIRFKLPWLARLMPFLSMQLLDRSQSGSLGPPWPDILLVAEGALGPVALDVRRRSNGKTKIVCLGRPRGRPSEFDLIITTPQFCLSPGPNVLELTLPVHSLDSELMGKKAAELLPHLSQLRRPWIVLLVGGSSAPEVLDQTVANDMACRALAEADCSGGTLLVVTSSRTGQKIEGAIRDALGERAHYCFWDRVRSANPYLGYLHIADRLIVTSDSISMLTEAIGTGKPVSIFRLPQRTTLLQRAVALIYSLDIWPFKMLFHIGLLQLLPQRGRILDRLEKSGYLLAQDIFNRERAQAKARTYGLIGEASESSRAAALVKETVMP